MRSKVDVKEIAWMNQHPRFWEIYRMPCGMVRRRYLMDVFRESPQAMIAVNRSSQANLKDKDLQYFMKRGILKRDRFQKIYSAFRHSRQTVLIIGKLV